MLQPNTFQRIRLFFTASIGRKIYSIVGLTLSMAFMMVLIGSYIAQLENVLLAMARMEREWVDVKLSGFRNFNKYLLTQDPVALQRTIDNLEHGYRIDQVVPHMQDAATGRDIDEHAVAQLIDRTFRNCDYDMARQAIFVIKWMGWHEYVQTLIEQWSLALSDSEKFMPAVQEYVANPDEQWVEEIFTYQETFKQRGDIFSDTLGLLADFAHRVATISLWVVFAVFGIIALWISILITRSIDRSLTGAVDALQAGSNDLIAASQQITTSSLSLSEGASQQAASLEQTSSSLEEIASMTHNNADNALQVRDMAQNAAQEIETLSYSMNEIKEASHSISGITKTIDSIAFQTNILSLNAAVEAARAGEAGMGFAVVADEVRNLAMRSADAAQDIATRIEDSVQKGENGVVITERVTQNFELIHHRISEISSATQEQSEGINQINQAVTKIEQITQDNTHMADQNSNEATKLNGQAASVQKIVQDLSSLVDGQNGTSPSANFLPTKISVPSSRVQHEVVVPKQDTRLDDF